VFGGGVAEDLVDHHLQAQPVGLGQQRVEVDPGTEQRVDTEVVGHVVAEVAHRAREEGREPDAVDTQRGDVGQLGRHAGQVADAVAVGVGKAARVDLVEGGAAPPVAAHRQ
jgi:hypothetical protein